MMFHSTDIEHSISRLQRLQALAAPLAPPSWATIVSEVGVPVAMGAVVPLVVAALQLAMPPAIVNLATAQVNAAAPAAS